MNKFNTSLFHSFTIRVIIEYLTLLFMLLNRFIKIMKQKKYNCYLLMNNIV